MYFYFPYFIITGTTISPFYISTFHGNKNRREQNILWSQAKKSCLSKHEEWLWKNKYCLWNNHGYGTISYLCIHVYYATNEDILNTLYFFMFVGGTWRNAMSKSSQSTNKDMRDATNIVSNNKKLRDEWWSIKLNVTSCIFWNVCM